jgi:hypothetical protein
LAPSFPSLHSSSSPHSSHLLNLLLLPFAIPFQHLTILFSSHLFQFCFSSS